MSKDSNILIKAEEILGFLPSNQEEAVGALHSRLKDLGEEDYIEVTDIRLLIEIISILEGTDVTGKSSPWERVGRLIDVDEWKNFPSFKKLVFIAREREWTVLERKLYYTFSINGRIFFKIEGIRKTSSEEISCRIVIPRVTDIDHLHLLLDTYNLLQFKDRDWILSVDKKLNESEVHGRYFFVSELEIFINEIANRV